MNKTNVIKLLASLNENELKRLARFVQSPYFNTNEKLTGLFDILKTYYPEFDALELSRENLFARLYKGKKFVGGTINYLISELESLIEKFISIERLNKFYLEVTLLEELSKINMDKMYDKKYRELKKKLQKLPEHGFVNNFLLSYIHRASLIERKEFLTRKDTYKKEWFEPVDELFKMFLDNMLWNIQLISGFKHSHNPGISVPMFDEIMKYMESGSRYNKDVITRITYHQIKLFMDYNESDYLLLKKILKENSKKIPVQKIEQLITSLHNYCYKQIFNGKDFYEESFEVHKLYLRYMFSGNNLEIPIDVFFQIFVTAVVLGKHDWAKEFISKYVKRLNERFRNNAVHYSSARLHFAEREYEKTLKELSMIKHYSYIHYKPAVKILQLMTYYELGLFAEAEDIANSFVQFLRNDKLLNDDTKTAYKNFLSVYFKLLNAIHSGSDSKIAGLKLSIDRYKNLLTGKPWFIKKIGEIESRTAKRIKAV